MRCQKIQKPSDNNAIINLILRFTEPLPDSITSVNSCTCLILQFDDCVLTVNVLDLNDNPPEFMKSSYTFTAKRENGYVIGQVQVLVTVFSCQSFLFK